MESDKLFDLSGMVAVVTGGNGGIGRSLALGFAGAGCAVAIIGRNEAKNQQVIEELKDTGQPVMAMQLAPYNIQVNAIAPGWFKTDMTAPVRSDEMKEMNDEIIARTPAGRWGDSDELVGTAIFLASHASDFVTGAMIPVDGGYSSR